MEPIYFPINNFDLQIVSLYKKVFYKLWCCIFKVNYDVFKRALAIKEYREKGKLTYE